MKASVAQQQLLHGLNVVSRAVAQRSSLQVLSNILIATDQGRLRLSATNLELGISCWIEAQITEEGAITIPSRTLNDLVAILPNDVIQLSTGAVPAGEPSPAAGAKWQDYSSSSSSARTLTIRCAGSNTDIKGIDAQEFPPIPTPDLSGAVEIKVALLKEMIQQVVFAASNDEARPVLQGVMLNISGGEITLVATDGFRVSVRKAPLDGAPSKDVSVIVPGKALSELARIASDGDQILAMVLPPARGQVIFHLKDAELVSQLIEGNFPDYKAILPRNHKTRTILPTPLFLKACRQAEIIARDANYVVRMNIQPEAEKPGQVLLTARSEETGFSEISLDATIEGIPIEIAFNVHFLREVLDVIKAPSIALQTIAHNAPGMITPLGDESFIHIIMPMHLG